MTAAVVQGKTYNNSTAASTITITPDASYTAGSLAVLCVSWWDQNGINTAPTVSDGVNTWTRHDWRRSGNTNKVAIFSAPNVANSAPGLVFTHNGGGTQYIAARLTEFSGIETSSPFDVATGSTGAQSNDGTTGTTANTAQANELVVCVFGHADDANMATPSGYTSLLLISSNAIEPISAAYKSVTSIGGQSASQTFTTTPDWAASIATFKESGGGGGGSSWRNAFAVIANQSIG